MKNKYFNSFLPAALVLLCGLGMILSANAQGRIFQTLHTDSGVEFGVYGPAQLQTAAPVLIVLSGSLEESLQNEYFRQTGTALSNAHGWISVSIDLPYHGKLQSPKYANGLEAWAAAALDKTDFVAFNNQRLKSVIDYLVEKGYANKEMIYACGTSRGAFMALHYAAFDYRVKAIAAFAPVVDLKELKEFKNTANLVLTIQYDLKEHLNALGKKHVWIVIGDADTRVNTDAAIAFARMLSARNYALKKEGGTTELLISPEPKGHTTPRGAKEKSLNWFLQWQPALPAWDSLQRPDIYKDRVEWIRAKTKTSKDIVFLGNSISFWGDWQFLIPDKTIINAGIPGDNSYGVIDRLRDITTGKPQKIFVLIGINDLSRNIPVEKVIQNYHRIIQQIQRESPRTKIYIQTLLPVNNFLHRTSPIYNTADRILLLNASIKNLPILYPDLSIVDLYNEFTDQNGKLRQELTWDGIHLNLKGYQKWVSLLKKEKHL